MLKKRHRVFLLIIMTCLAVGWISAVPFSSVHAAEDFEEFLKKQGTPPPGANDPACRPDESHPVPIVLVPGTFETMLQNWSVLSPRLAKKEGAIYWRGD